MKRILLPALILLFNVAHSQNVGIGTGSPAAKLDITSTNSGVLIPRVALTGTNSASPLTSPAISTLIYNTAAAGSGATAVVPGYYYWNGSAWVQLIDNSSLTGSTTVSNTSSANTLSTTVNGVTGATVPIVNSNTLSLSTNTLTSIVNGIVATSSAISGVNNTSSANTLSTTVNGVTGATVPIINTNTLSLSGNTLTSDVNGVSPTQSLSGLTLSGDVTGTLGATTISKIQGTGMAIASLAANNVLQYNGTNWVNVTPASILTSTTTVGNTSSTNTLSTTVNGVTGSTVPIVNSIGNTSSANTLSTTVNGVAGTTVPIINSNTSAWTQSAGLTNTVNGVAANVNPASGTITNVLGYSSSGAPVYQAASGIGVTNTLALSTNTLTSTVNGVTATSNAVSGVNNTSSANTLSTTVNGVTGSTVPIINSNLLSLSTNTLTSTVNGQAATSSAVSGVGNTWTQSAGLTTTVNGVTGNINPASGTITNVLGYNSSGAPVYQAMTSATHGVSNTISGNTISTTVDGSTGTAVTVPNIYTANGTLTGARTVTMSGNTLGFTGGNVGIGITSPPSPLSVEQGAAGGNSNWYDPTNFAAFIQDNVNNTQKYGLLVTDYWRSSENYVFAVDGRYYVNGTVSGDSHNPYLVVRGDGNVGIGTSAPGNLLDVEGGNIDASGYIMAGGTGGGAVLFSGTTAVNGGGVAGGLSFESRPRIGDWGQWLTIGEPNGTNGGMILQIQGSAMYTGTSTGITAAPTLRNTLDNGSGYMGIGTTSPASPLEVDQNYSGTVPSLFLKQPVATWGTTALFASYRYIQTTSAATDGNFRAFNVGAGGVTIGYPSTPVYGSGDALYVNGNVGIGTSAPSAQLHATGTVRFASYPNSVLTTDGSGNLQATASSTMITTSNIASQSVAYATSCGCRGSAVINFANSQTATLTHNCNTTSNNIILFNGDAGNSPTTFVQGVSGVGANSCTVRLSAVWNGLYRVDYIIDP